MIFAGDVAETIDGPSERTCGGPEDASPPGAGAVSRRERAIRGALMTLAAVLGLGATAHLALAGRGLGSGLVAPDLWFYDSTPRLVIPGTELDPAIVDTFAAVGVWAAAWLVAGAAVRRGTSVRAVLLLGLTWSLPLLVAPPLFSPDAYAYTAIGAAIEHGVDPYLLGPGAAGDIPAVRGAETFWRESPTAYSPPFLVLLSTLSWLFSEDLISVLIALRVLSLAAWVAVAFFVVRLARRWAADPARALWLGVANPLVVVNAVSANHNDVLMMALVVPGLLLASAARPWWGSALCGAAAGIKVTALVAVLVISVEHARRQVGWWRRLRALVLCAVVGSGTFVALAQVAGYGWGWLANLSVPAKAIGPLAPSTSLAVALDVGHPPLDTVRLAALGLGAVLCLAVLTRLSRWGLVRVTGWLLLIVVAVGPVVWPWYFLAPITVFAAAAGARERQALVLISVAMLFATLPGGQPTLPLLGSPLAEHLVLAALATVLGWYAAVSLTDRWRSRRRPSPTGAPEWAPRS